MDTQKFINAYQAELDKAKLLFVLTDERLAMMVDAHKLDLELYVAEGLSLRNYYAAYNSNLEDIFIASAEFLAISSIENLPDEAVLSILNSYSELFTEEGLEKAEETAEYCIAQANADVNFIHKLNDFVKWIVNSSHPELADGRWVINEKQVVDSRLAKDIFSIMYSAWSMRKAMMELTAGVQILKFMR